MLLGIWARLRAARGMADTFGTKLRGFAAPTEEVRASLTRLISEKSQLLLRLDPTAQESTFSVTLVHLLRQPATAFAYIRLVREEERLMGARRSVSRAQAWWRPLHMILALSFVIGLSVHVLLVTFFAGYVADGRPIVWWHITAWGL